MGEAMVLFTQQTIGLGARKTSMVFLAEAWRDLGYDVHVVTCQLSWLTRLKRTNKLAGIPADRVNRWYVAEGMRGFVWVPPAHPATFGGPIDRLLGEALMTAYAASLPGAIRRKLRDAALVVVESCSAAALFRAIKRAAPSVPVVYSMSDRLLAVGMHPALQRRVEADARDYALIRVPASAMLEDLPGSHTVCIRHGLDKTQFEHMHANPFARPGNAILIGDMMLDRAVLEGLASQFPQTDFHYFGRVTLGMPPLPNLVDHGEVPFAALVPYLQWADVGLSLYREIEGLEYLAESSLKNIQYSYCGVPIVAPHFVLSGQSYGYGYPSGDVAGAVAAMQRALAAGRKPLGSASVDSWGDVASAILREARVARVPAGSVPDPILPG
jgi:2-beta-glucuronyltransferase